jgi:hypothetical protein
MQPQGEGTGTVPTSVNTQLVISGGGAWADAVAALSTASTIANDRAYGDPHMGRSAAQGLPQTVRRIVPGILAAGLKAITELQRACEPRFGSITCTHVSGRGARYPFSKAVV